MDRRLGRCSLTRLDYQKINFDLYKGLSVPYVASTYGVTAKWIKAISTPHGLRFGSGLDREIVEALFVHGSERYRTPATVGQIMSILSVLHPAHHIYRTQVNRALQRLEKQGVVQQAGQRKKFRRWRLYAAEGNPVCEDVPLSVWSLFGEGMRSRFNDETKRIASEGNTSPLAESSRP